MREDGTHQSRGTSSSYLPPYTIRRALSIHLLYWRPSFRYKRLTLSPGFPIILDHQSFSSATDQGTQTYSSTEEAVHLLSKYAVHHQDPSPSRAPSYWSISCPRGRCRSRARAAESPRLPGRPHHSRRPKCQRCHLPVRS